MTIVTLLIVVAYLYYSKLNDRSFKSLNHVSRTVILKIILKLDWNVW